MTRGDAAERFTDGLRVLRASRSTADTLRGISLIETAAEAGHRDALERSALFQWARSRQPAKRAQALERLQHAAELGSASACRQLMLLADPETYPGEPDVADAAFWTKLRKHIDLQRLLEAPPARALKQRPLVAVIEHFATPAECRWIMEVAKPWLDTATVHDESTGALRPDPLRTNRSAILTLDRLDLVLQILRERISAKLSIPMRRLEAPQVMRYAPGEEFKAHFDFFDPSVPGFRKELARNGQRVATLLIYLNEDFEGGETRFPSMGLDYRGRTGDAIFFASVDPDGRPNPLTLHCGLPPISGEKWIYSQWARDRAPGEDARAP